MDAYSFLGGVLHGSFAFYYHCKSKKFEEVYNKMVIKEPADNYIRKCIINLFGGVAEVLAPGVEKTDYFKRIGLKVTDYFRNKNTVEVINSGFGLVEMLQETYGVCDDFDSYCGGLRYFMSIINDKFNAINPLLLTPIDKLSKLFFNLSIKDTFNESMSILNELLICAKDFF